MNKAFWTLMFMSASSHSAMPIPKQKDIIIPVSVRGDIPDGKYIYTMKVHKSGGVFIIDDKSLLEVK